jgi:PhnB protein
MHIQQYLFFDGRCEEAIEFQAGVGAKVEMLMRFKDSPDRRSPAAAPRLGKQGHARVL